MPLTRMLRDPRSPIRAFYDEHLPQLGTAREQFRTAIQHAETLLPPSQCESPPWDLLGHAISHQLLWHLQPPAQPFETVLGETGLGEQVVGGELASNLVSRCDEPELRELIGAACEKGPVEVAPLEAAGVSWIAGVDDRAMRSGRFDDPQLERLRTARTLDELAPAGCLDDIAAVAGQCLAIVEPHKASGVHVAPSFGGSRAVGGADADYITHSGSLIDIKTTKSPALLMRDLQQIVGYALLDWDDVYEIRQIGLLMTRQARLIMWDLDQLVGAATSGQSDIASLRQELRSLLSTST